MGVQEYIFYSSASNSSFGFGVRAETYIKKIKFNRTLTSFSYRSEHYSGYFGSSTSSGVIQAELKIYINDILVLSRDFSSPGSPDPDNIIFDGTVSCSNVNKIRVYARTWAGANSRTITVTTTLDQTYYLYEASNTLTTINSTSLLNIILPAASLSNSIMRIIKALLSNNNKFITVYDEDLIDDNQYNTIVLNQYECVTFICANNAWYIANYYTNNIISTSTNVTNANKIANTSVSRVNVFSVNSNSNRQSGDNRAILPIEENGKMCIVAYVGNASSKSAGNALSFSTSSGRGIDNKYNNTNNFPYIVTDSNVKSTGIVFVSDGTYWYIVGWYNTTGQYWGTDLTPSSTLLTPTRYINFNYLATSPLNTTARYVLPQYSSGIGTNSYFYILKNRNITGGFGIELYTNTHGSGINNVFNETQNVIQNNSTAKRSYGCVWMVSEVRSGETKIHWYPVLNYQ